MQVFKAAQTPVHPFKLSIRFGLNIPNSDGWIKEQEKTVLNAISHEQLSISISRDGDDGFKARIERFAKRQLKNK